MPDTYLCANGHEWQPVSFVFESQLLDSEGRVLIRQPSIDAGRVYCVCVPCGLHTYLVTRWAGYCLADEPETDEATEEEGDAHA
jgi:hypothetical protein